MFGKVPFGAFGFDPPGEHSVEMTGVVTEIIRPAPFFWVFSRMPRVVISFDSAAYEEARRFFQRNEASWPTQTIEIFWNEKGRFSLPQANDRVRVTFSCPDQRTAWCNEICVGISTSRIIRNFEVLCTPA